MNSGWAGERRGRGMAAALAAGLLLRMWFVWRYSQVSEDSLLYGDIAQNLLKHGVYGISTVANGVASVRPTLIRLPGYPLFLAGCFALFGAAKYGAVLLVQVALDLWTCLLLAGAARRIFGARAGWAALWMGALCPFLANYAAAALSETPTLFCMALAFYAVVRWREVGMGINRWAGVLAFALAWGILLRPEQGLVAAAVVPALIWMSYKGNSNSALIAGGAPFVGFWTLRVFRAALIVSVITVLPLAPWAVRNWRTMHVFQPLAPRYANDPGEVNPYGFQRWFRTWAVDFASTDQVYWNYETTEISIGDLPNRAFDSNEQYAETEAALALYNQTTTATPALDARFAAMARERIKADPLRFYVALPIARVVNMVLRPRLDNLPIALDWWVFHAHREQTVFAFAYAALNLAYLALAGVALWRRVLWAAWAPVVWAMSATMFLRALMLLNLDNSEPRYTLELYPVLIVLGAGVVARLREKAQA